jgi:hypothetical protein
LLPDIDDKMAKKVEIVVNKKVVKIVKSIQDLMYIVGIKSRTTIKKYINHVKGFYAPSLDQVVNIRHPNVSNLLIHKIIHRKTKDIPELVIPNQLLSTLIPNILYVYNNDFTLVKTYKFISESVKDLNPNYNNLGISLRGREIAISRGKNKQNLIYNEKGLFYFAENPTTNRWKLNHKGKYSLILKDITNNKEISFKGIRPVQKYL